MKRAAIQALDRLDPVLPLSPGRAERHGFEYFRHGTLSLYAALNTASGVVLGKTASRHTSAEFVAFLQEVVANVELGRASHIIADNLSTHKTKAVEAFLSEHPHVHLHFTPTYFPGSTKSKSGSRRSSATLLPEASSNPRQILPGDSCVTSATITKRRSLSAGATKILPSEYDKLFTLIRYTALVGRSASMPLSPLKLTLVPALCVFSTWRFWEPPTHPCRSCGRFAIKRQRPLLFLFPQFGYSQLRSQQGEGGSTDLPLNYQLSTINCCVKRGSCSSYQYG